MMLEWAGLVHNFAHLTVVLRAGTPRLLTAWMPLGALPPEQGSLLVAAGSHRLPEFATLRAGYGQSQARISICQIPALCLRALPSDATAVNSRTQARAYWCTCLQLHQYLTVHWMLRLQFHARLRFFSAT